MAFDGHAGEARDSERRVARRNHPLLVTRSIAALLAAVVACWSLHAATAEAQQHLVRKAHHDPTSNRRVPAEPARAPGTGAHRVREGGPAGGSRWAAPARWSGP